MSALPVAHLALVAGLRRLPVDRPGALHRRLDAGWDAGVHRRLLRVDGVRVAAATGSTAAALWLVLTAR